MKDSKILGIHTLDDFGALEEFQITDWEEESNQMESRHSKKNVKKDGKIENTLEFNERLKIKNHQKEENVLGIQKNKPTLFVMNAIPVIMETTVKKTQSDLDETKSSPFLKPELQTATKWVKFVSTALKFSHLPIINEGVQ